MKRFDQINVIPFIDIMLVMLAIVLTTATFISSQNIALTLPEAENSTKDEIRNPVNIAIDTAGRFYLADKAVERNDLKEQLASMAKKTPIIVAVDQETAFKNFMFLIDLLKGLQLENLSIKVNKPSHPA